MANIHLRIAREVAGKMLASVADAAAVAAIDIFEFAVIWLGYLIAVAACVGIRVGIPLTMLYALVRFVKWAWVN